MPLSIGDKLGPYEILAPLGAGVWAKCIRPATQQDPRHSVVHSGSNAASLYELNYYKEACARLTWQATPRNRFTASYSFQRNCNCFFGIAAGNLAPEAAGNNLYRPDNNFQATWTAPVTSKLLLWAGVTLVKGQVNRQFSGGTSRFSTLPTTIVTVPPVRLSRAFPTPGGTRNSPISKRISPLPI